MPSVVATESKPPELMSPPESINNSKSKALELQETQRDEQGPRDVAVALPSGEHAAEEEMDQVKPIPRAGMEEHVSGKELQSEDNITNARQLERHLRPLLVHPVISRNGDIIHAENQLEEEPSVEPMGIPTHDLASSEIVQSPKRDITWWEEKREAEALALEAKEDGHEKRERSPLAVREPETFNNDKQQDGAVECMPTGSQDTAVVEPEMLLPTVFGGNLGQVDQIHSEGEEMETEYPHRRDNGSPEDSFAQDPKRTVPIVKAVDNVETDDLVREKALRESPQADNFTAESRSTCDKDLHDDAPAPADVPLAASTSRGSLSPNDGYTPFETACEHFDVEQHSPSAINDHTRSHENEHVSFTDDVHDDYHDSYFEYHSRDPSAPRTEFSATPEREFSSEGEEHEGYSVSSQGNPEQEEYLEIIVREAASVALPRELDDSYSISDASDHTSPSDIQMELDDGARDHHPGIADVGDLGEEEVEIPLERLPSRRPEPDLHQNIQDVRAEVTLTTPTGEGMELRSPLLMPIPEYREVHHRMEDSVGSSQEEFGLRIRDSYAKVQHLDHDCEDGDNSDYDNISHNDFDEDDYMHPNSAMNMQPSRTDQSARGSLAVDGGLQELEDYVSRPGQRDVESNYGDRGSVGDHPDYGVLPGPMGLGLEERGAGAEQSVQAANDAAPVPRDGISEDKNLADRYQASSEPASVPPSPTPMPKMNEDIIEDAEPPITPGMAGDHITSTPEVAPEDAALEMDVSGPQSATGELCSTDSHQKLDATSTADSEDVRHEENVAHAPVDPLKDPHSQTIDGETEVNSSVVGQLGDVAVAEVQYPESPGEAADDVSPIETSTPSGLVSLDAHGQESSTAAIKDDHTDFDINGQMAEETFASPGLRSPGPIHSVQESLADQLRRASWEEANKSYHDDEPSQLEREDEYATTVHGEAGLFDDESSDGASAYGEQRYDAEATQEDSHARTPAEDRSFDTPQSDNVTGQHQDQANTPVALGVGETQVTQQTAEEDVDEPQSASPSEQLAVGPEASAKSIEAESNASRETTHGIREPHSPVQSEESHEDKDKQLQSLPRNQLPDEAEVSAQVDLHIDDFHQEPEIPNPTLPIETPVPARPEERLDLDDTQQQADFSSVAVPVESKLKSPEQEIPHIDRLEQQTSRGTFFHEATVLTEPEGPEFQQSVTPVPTLMVHDSQHEPPRRRSWIEEADEYFDEEDKEQQTNAETPLMQSTESSLQAYQQTPQSAEKGLAASRHESDRPQTPEDDEETVDRGSNTWHTRHASSPQSMRSGSTLSSAPSSPVQTRDSHEPVIRGLVNTSSPSYAGRPRNDSSLTEYTGRPRNDSSLTEYNPHESSELPKTQFSSDPLASRWGPSGEPFGRDRNSHRKSDVGSGGGSLFQRMRSVFETAQPDNSNSPRASWTGGYSSRNSSSRYSADEHGDSEQSGLLNDRYNGLGH